MLKLFNTQDIECSTLLQQNKLIIESGISCFFTKWDASIVLEIFKINGKLIMDERLQSSIHIKFKSLQLSKTTEIEINT